MDGYEILNQLIIKILFYLSRPVVQEQLIVIILALGAGWGISRGLRWWWWKYGPGRKRVETAVPESPRLVDETGNKLPEEDFEVSPDADFNPDKPPEDPTLPSAEKWFRRYIWSETRWLLTPLSVLGTMTLARFIAVSQDEVTGLIDQAIYLLTLFAIYRFFIGLLYAGFEDDVIAGYQQRLFGPVFWLFVLLDGIAWFFEPSILADIELVSMFGNPLTVGAVLLSTLGLYLWLQIVSVIQAGLQWWMTRSDDANEGAVAASLTLVRYILIIMGILFVFSELQLSTATVAAVTGGVSAGLAFGSSEILNNFISGILLLFERSVRPGDIVEIGGTMGVIKEMNIRATVLRAFDGRELIIPNRQVFTSTVTSLTHGSRRSRITLEIGVAYGTDLRQALEILQALPKKHPNIIDDPASDAFLTGFGESSINFLVFAWVEDIAVKFRTSEELYLMVWDEFAQHGIEIPFPQRDINVKVQNPADVKGMVKALDEVLPPSDILVAGHGATQTRPPVESPPPVKVEQPPTKVEKTDAAESGSHEAVDEEDIDDEEKLNKTMQTPYDMND